MCVGCWLVQRNLASSRRLEALVASRTRNVPNVRGEPGSRPSSPIHTGVGVQPSLKIVMVLAKPSLPLQVFVGFAVVLIVVVKRSLNPRLLVCESDPKVLCRESREWQSVNFVHSHSSRFACMDHRTGLQQAPCGPSTATKDGQNRRCGLSRCRDMASPGARRYPVRGRRDGALSVTWRM